MRRAKVYIDAAPVYRRDQICENCSAELEYSATPGDCGDCIRISTREAAIYLCYDCYKDMPWRGSKPYLRTFEESVKRMENWTGMRYLTDEATETEPTAFLLKMKLEELGKLRDKATGLPEQLPLFGIGSLRVFFADFTTDFLKKVRRTDDLYELDDEQFEQFVCDRLYVMGLEVERTTKHSRSPDGGIDIIAWSRSAPFAGLIAVQCKHHKTPHHKVGVNEVRELEGVVLGNRVFSTGVLVTNTSFTSGAEWIPTRLPMLIRLRDVNHLAKWIANDFADEHGITELPEYIELAAGIRIPKIRFSSTGT